MTKAKSDKPLRQIAALPWRRRGDSIEVLLVTSRETRRWVIAKGNRMVDLDDPAAAAEEAYEEAGVQGEVARVPFGHYPYDKRQKDGRLVPCVVDVYPLEVLIQLGSWPEVDQRQRQWMGVSEASASVNEPELAALIDSFGAKSR